MLPVPLARRACAVQHIQAQDYSISKGVASLYVVHLIGPVAQPAQGECRQLPGHEGTWYYASGCKTVGE